MEAGQEAAALFPSPFLITTEGTWTCMTISTGRIFLHAWKILNPSHFFQLCTMKPLPPGVRNDSLQLQHIPLTFTDPHQSSTWFERFLSFPNGTNVIMCCGDASPNVNFTLWTSLAHALTRTVIFSPPSSPFITIPGRQVLLGKHFVMKLSPDLLFELVSVLPFNNNLFSAAKVEQLVSIINIMRFYCSNSLKSACLPSTPQIHRWALCDEECCCTGHGMKWTAKTFIINTRRNHFLFIHSQLIFTVFSYKFFYSDATQPSPLMWLASLETVPKAHPGVQNLLAQPPAGASSHWAAQAGSSASVMLGCDCRSQSSAQLSSGLKPSHGRAEGARGIHIPPWEGEFPASAEMRFQEVNVSYFSWMHINPKGERRWKYLPWFFFF